MSNPEPWLRGPLPDVHPSVMPVFFSFAQVREDLAEHTQGLTQEQLWRRAATASIGFHLKHLAGSVDRLSTYLEGGQLSPEQLDRLRRENTPDADLSQLIEHVHISLRRAEEKLKAIDPNDLYAARAVGRQHLPTSVIGLLVHLAEHTQRHLGQIITLSQIVRQPG